ncbi:MAG: BlaI/MecI/CopY family transcriptional regulator [Oscillospiraceae bacterium]
MPREKGGLTRAEWSLLECLWEASPRTGREAVEYMAAHTGWNRSTTLTMLRRMTEKGQISCTEEDGLRVYRPLVAREEAVREETGHFLDRVYHGSLSMLLSTFTEDNELTKEEIDRLYAILRQAEEEAGK